YILLSVSRLGCLSSFYFTCTSRSYLSTLSLHDALPICSTEEIHLTAPAFLFALVTLVLTGLIFTLVPTVLARKSGLHQLIKETTDRKSTRLNSSHLGISYAVFCSKKKRTAPTRLYISHD